MGNCDGYRKYAIATTKVAVSFAISTQGAVIDNCMYCPYLDKGGSFCHLYMRHMADAYKRTPVFL